MERGEVRSWLDDPVKLARRGAESGARPAEGATDSPVQRRALCDRVFGRGFLLPGGEAELMRLVRPMHLGAMAKLLVIGAGVAGPCRVLAGQLGIKASGYERRFGDRTSERVDEDAAFAFSWWQPGRDALPVGEFHHALALTPLAGDVPEPLLAGIVKAVRAGGHVVLVDYVATDSFDPTDPLTRGWLREEGRSRPPDTEQDLARVLGRLGLHLRSAEDLSRAHTRLAVFDWRRMLNGLRERPTLAGGQVMLDEAELWRVRAALLERDQLRLVRMHAMVPSG